MSSTVTVEQMQEVYSYMEQACVKMEENLNSVGKFVSQMEEDVSHMKTSMQDVEKSLSRFRITLSCLESALEIGAACFYFYDDTMLLYNLVYRITSKRPLYDNGHPIPELNPSDKESLEHMLKNAGVPFGQGYYVILR